MTIAHLYLAAAIIIWIVLVLHLPYRVERRRDTRGRAYGIWQSVLYRYEYGPTRESLDYEGLRRLQYIILDLLRETWVALQGNLLRRLADELRWWMGL